MSGPSTDRPRPAQDRTLGVTVLGPGADRCCAWLLDDHHQLIAPGFIDPPGTAHYAFRVLGRYTGGAYLRVESAGFVPYEERLKIGGNTEDIGLPLGDTEMDLVTLVPLGAVDLPPTIRLGVVQANKKAIFDGTGPFHPRGATWFWMLQAWKRDRDRLKRNAEWWADPKRKPDYFRVLCEVGGGPWTGNDIDWTTPEWADGQEVLAQVLDYFYNEIGVRLELTILGKGTKVKPVWLAGLVGDVVADSRQHMVLDIEMANEASGGDEISIATMQEMAAVVKAKVPNIIVLSNPGQDDWDEMEAATKKAGLKGFSVHLRRKFLYNGWSHVRQGYDNKNTRLLVLNNEPAGPASSVEQQTHPLLLAMTRAVSVSLGGAAYVFHSGTGVFGDGKPHPSAGKRPANFDEIPNVDAQLDALWGLDALLPEGVENWDVKNTQRAGIPFDLPASEHWGNPDSSGFGVNKAYAAVSPRGEFIQLPIGVIADDARPCRMTAPFPMTGVTVFDTLTRQPLPGLDNVEFAAGQRLTLPGRLDSMAAYVIRGQKA